MSQPDKLTEKHRPEGTPGHDRPICRSPVTGSKDVALVETISTAILISRWQSEYGIDISEELKGVTRILKYRCNDTGVNYFEPSETAGSEWLYTELQTIPWYYQKEKWEYRIARNELRDCMSILEIGCGTGEFLKFIKPDGHQLAGTELNQQAAARARQEGLDVTAEPLSNLASESFDAVCCFQVLEHVIDPGDFIRSMVKLVRPGGKIVVAVPNSAGFVGLGYDLLQYPPHHMSWWTVESFQKLPTFFPIAMEKLVPEPLSQDHIDIYVRWHLWDLRERFRLSYLGMNDIPTRLFRRLLKTRLRQLFTGHSLYAEFIRL